MQTTPRTALKAPGQQTHPNFQRPWRMNRPPSTSLRATSGPSVELSLALVDSVESIGQEAWDACAGTDNPLNSYAFLEALERSNSACITTGWAPQHLKVNIMGGATVAVAPLYLKGHPYGTSQTHAYPAPGALSH